ncbi:hypothetical protein [Streptomyces chartreusis]|uniref:hypothetical protein n=1 Tax=Streptomyces chartreusis TaxID=1969 RepID=UPI0033BCEE5C
MIIVPLVPAIAEDTGTEPRRGLRPETRGTALAVLPLLTGVRVAVRAEAPGLWNGEVHFADAAEFIADDFGVPGEVLGLGLRSARGG